MAPSVRHAAEVLVGRAASARMRRTHPQVCCRAEVVRTAEVSPHLRRVTFTAPQVADWPDLGSDQYVRLLLARPGQSEPVLPATSAWYAEMMQQQPGERPVLRNYTVRALRPEIAEVDVDFVRHADGGPASRWCETAAPGDVVGLIEQGVMWEPGFDADHLLLVADESGLPALENVLAAAPPEAAVTAVVEVPSADDVRELANPSAAQVVWCPRADAHAKPGELLLPAVTGLEPPEGRVRAWVAGESGMVTGVRRFLVRHWGAEKSDISFQGYFKHGRAQYAG